MIAAGPGINVMQNPVYITPGAQSAGMVRWNPTYSRMEVYDGNTWLPMGATTVQLDYETQELLNWARQRRRQDQELEQLIKQSPAIRDLHEKLELTKALVRREIEQQNL